MGASVFSCASPGYNNIYILNYKRKDKIKTVWIIDTI